MRALGHYGFVAINQWPFREVQADELGLSSDEEMDDYLHLVILPQT